MDEKKKEKQIERLKTYSKKLSSLNSQRKEKEKSR